jgi:Conserved TM helix
MVLAASPGLIKLGVVAGLIVFGLFLAPLVGRIVRTSLSKPSRSLREQTIAEPASRFLTTLLVTGSLIGALGVVSPSSLEPFPTKIIEFVPRLLIAVLFLIVGTTVATLVANGVGGAISRATGRPNPALVRIVRGAVVALVSILAVSQLGIDTTIVDTLTQATIFAAAGALALLSVFGGKTVASEVAAGRYVRRIVEPGDEIESALGIGRVVAIHGATIELDPGDGSTVHLPHAGLLSGALKIKRSVGLPPQQ